ncbi:Fibronectin type III [Spirosomataceae bacterium]
MQATPLLQPPYSLALNDYQGPASKLRVQLLLRDLTKPSLEVYISLRLSGFGVELQSNPSVAALNTFVLQPGVPLTISGSELSPLFAQMLAQGVNYDELLAGASLPGGYYTWEVVAYLPDDRQVSNTGRASMSVFKAQPPQITFPAHQATVASTGIGSVPFQWISRSTSPASVLGTIYDLKIYELPDEVTDPNVAVLSGLLPVFNTQTASTSYFYGPGDPLLQPGKRYAIVVQAQDIGGGDSYENQGLSQVVAFKVAGEPDAAAQAACPAPTGLNIRQEDARTLEVSWNPVAEANDYLLQFRKVNEPWQSQTTTDNGLMLIQLSPAKYEVQVATRCNAGLVSTVSPLVNYEIGIVPKDSTADEIEDVLSYYNEDEVTPEPAKYEEAEEPYKDPLDDLILTVTYTDTTGKERTYTSLPPNPTTEQLKQATVAIKPQCVALSTGYSCGIHDNPAAPTGAEYMPKAGDELAMGSTMMEVVKIDGSGNGLGIATVKAFNNAKFGVEFIGIKVREGGCIYAGEAITKSLDFALLSRTQREELAKYYAAYNTLLTAADSLAPEIAKGMNTMLDALKSKKTATRALLEENDLTKLPDILINCTDIATQSQATQDSLQKLYCGLQAGTIKGYKKADIKAAIAANIEFMNKLGPALKECNPANNFTPWEEKPCGGPCAFEFERYVVDEECLAKIQAVFGVSTQDEVLEDITAYLEFLKAINVIVGYFDQCESNNYLPPQGGLVPRCFWKPVVVNKNLRYITDPSFASGIIDGFYGEAVALSKIGTVITDINSTVSGVAGYYLQGDCSKSEIDNLEKKYKDYERKYSKFAAISVDDKNLIEWFFGKVRLHQLKNVKTQLIECKKVEQSIEIVKSVAAFFSDYGNIVAATDKIMNRVDDFMQKEFLNQNLDNTARYEQGKIVAQVLTTFLPLSYSKAKNVSRIDQTILEIEKNSVKFEAELGKVFGQGAGKTIEQVKSLLTNAPNWLKINDDLLKRLATESDDFIKKVDDYYKNAIPSNTPSGFNGEGVYSGVRFNKYGHPELTPHVSSPDHIVKIDMKGNYTSDMTDAKNKLVQQAFGGDATKVRKSIDPVTGNQSSGWSPFQIKQADGSWSEPYTWHHHQDGSSMYPVKKSVHDAIIGKHTGGREIVTKYHELKGFFYQP